ncbi:glycosyltransferase family 4 protein [Epibacterium ulvae]|uniref:glycosyltransferase family 4 protein n=1 Tax=Epibacterium ulvae TaxID=1156985 RepID=UPI0024925781|nr:glycosyltransferase family 1 protein [Epibacterium ulvae]
MFIHVNGRFLVQPISGVQRYARELLTGLDALLSEDPALAEALGPIHVWYPADATLIEPPQWKVLKITPLDGFKGHAWEQITLARKAAGDCFLINLCGAGPLMVAKQLLVIHDANIWTFPEAFSKSYRLFHKTMRRLLVQRVSHLGTVSRFSATELAGYLFTSAERFEVIYNSAEHMLHSDTTEPDEAVLARFNLEAGQYFFAAGNQSPNKNIARLIQAMTQLEDGALPLAVAGGFAPGVTQSTLEHSAQTRLLGRVSDAELRTLYANAAAFVWPSLYEGFGIPPLEAMMLGTPVLSSDSTAMPEVLGDAVTYFDPKDVDSIAAALRTFQTQSPEALQQMKAASIARAETYSWRKSAQQVLAILTEAKSSN